MALTLDDLESSPYLKLLVLGGAKSGKTWCTVRTCEKPVMVLNSDDKFSLTAAAKGVASKDFMWLMMMGESLQTTENCLSETRKLVEVGKIKTVIWDTCTVYAERSLKIYEKQSETSGGKTDGRKFYRNQKQHLMNIVHRLIALDCHVIVNAHYAPESAAIDDGLEKSGEGICPGIEGKARYDIPRAFQDVVYLDRKGDKREFICSSSGVWGPGSRNLPGVKSVPADVGKLWALMQKAPAEVAPIVAEAKTGTRPSVPAGLPPRPVKR